MSQTNLFASLNGASEAENVGEVRAYASIPSDGADIEVQVVMTSEGPIFDVVEDGQVVATMGMMWDEFADFLVERDN